MNNSFKKKQESFSFKLIAISIFSIASLTFLAYASSLKNGFVDWDDHTYVYENQNIRSIDLSFFKWVSTAVVNANWHPLTMFSYALDYSIWGLNPFGYHLINIVFHVLNTSLVFILALRLFDIKTYKYGNAVIAPSLSDSRIKIATALLTALLFGLHPLHVESVAWISERKDVLSGFFFLLSILAYLSSLNSSRAYFWMSLIFFMLSLLSKPMTITLPVVLLILNYYPLERLSLKSGKAKIKRVFIETTPFFALSLLSGALTVWTQNRSSAIASLNSSPMLERFDVAVRGFMFYIKKIILPFDLAPFYVRPFAHEFYNHVFFISLAAFIALSAISVILIRKKVLISAWLYYIVTLLPVIGIIQVSDHAAADRYMYLPSIGPFVLIGLAAGIFTKKYKHGLIMVSAISIFLLSTMFAITVKQTGVWRDSASLWSQEIKLYPTVQAYTKRANAYLRAGNFDNAIEDYTVVIKNTDEDLAQLYFLRGTAYLKSGNALYADKDFEKSLALNPKSPAVYYRNTQKQN